MTVNINGVNFNASHYLALGKKKGVQRLYDDHKEHEVAKHLNMEEVYSAFEKSTKEAEQK